MGIIDCNVRRRFMSDKIFCIIFVKASLNHANLKSVMETSSLLFSSSSLRLPRVDSFCRRLPIFPCVSRGENSPSHTSRTRDDITHPDDACIVVPRDSPKPLMEYMYRRTVQSVQANAPRPIVFNGPGPQSHNLEIYA